MGLDAIVPTRQVKSISKLFCIENLVRHYFIQIILILWSILAFAIKNQLHAINT